MASALVAARAAALAHYRAQLSTEVLDRAPLRFALPYFALIEGQQVRDRLNKRAVGFTVRLTFQLVSDPHDAGAAPSDTLIDAFDAASEAVLDLSAGGFSVRDQYIEEIAPFTDADERGAALHKTDITLLIEIR